MTHNSQLTTHKFRSLFFLVAGGLLLLPLMASAAPTDFKSLVAIIITILKSVVPVIAGLAVLYFFWGIAKFIFSSGSDDQKKEAKKIMTWGLIAIFVMFSFYGIIVLFGNALLPNFRSYDGQLQQRVGDSKQIDDPNGSSQLDKVQFDFFGNPLDN